MFPYYTFSPIEVLSFSEPYGTFFIGFFFKEKEEKEKLLKEVKTSLADWNILTIEELVQLLTQSITFVHIHYKGLIYKLNPATIQEYISAEQNFTSFIGKFISFLSRKEEVHLHELQQSNLIDFLNYRIEEKAGKIKLTEQAKSLEKYIDFNASDEAKKKKEAGEANPFLDLILEEADALEDETSFFFSEALEKVEDYSWFKYFINEELEDKEIVKKFPLFKGAEKDLQMQVTFLSFSSLEKGVDSGLVIKCWELYKKEQDFLAFLNFTNLCQNKLWELYHE